MCNNLDGMYLHGIMRVDDTDDYVIFIEKAGEDEDSYDIISSDNYQIKVHCDSVIMRWDRYLNRVEV